MLLLCIVPLNSSFPYYPMPLLCLLFSLYSSFSLYSQLFCLVPFYYLCSSYSLLLLCLVFLYFSFSSYIMLLLHLLVHFTFLSLITPPVALPCSPLLFFLHYPCCRSIFLFPFTFPSLFTPCCCSICKFTFTLHPLQIPCPVLLIPFLLLSPAVAHSFSTLVLNVSPESSLNFCQILYFACFPHSCYVFLFPFIIFFLLIPCYCSVFLFPLIIILFLFPATALSSCSP